MGIICQKIGILCESGSYSLHTAKAYITVIDFISITYVPYSLCFFRFPAPSFPADDLLILARPMLIEVPCCFQIRLIWLVVVLWSHQGRIERPETSLKVPLDQANCYVHVLSIVYRECTPH